jgi:hypothetical protein
MFQYVCSFFPAYISEDESTLHLFHYCTNGFEQKFSQPLAIGDKVCVSAFYDKGKNSFDPISYYPRKFKHFPVIEYRYGIVLDLLVGNVQEHGRTKLSSTLIALVTSSERLLEMPDIKFKEYQNPSPRNLNW